ncbi:cobalamin B12-binding domain-containing protein [Streptomyces calidiresistens]|uniref:Cobalamin-binding protein n=1 Tax=Streptomyces calidiresistens TaxID=1485586 RepID=A0A7W3T4C9_9ACTN|nr:B12-binding domain-containing protein [Streptomyces calidiresistens]MBB0230688.1 cobalamin-binding protein [Streptomyces calidiresistens]
MTPDTRPRVPVPTGPGTEEWADLLWEAVWYGDEQRAGDLAVAALDAGVEPEALFLDVIGAVQRKVGEEWAANRMSVAREHAATAINERVIAALSRHPAVRREPTRGRITIACVDGEWHALPGRLLGEVLKLRGWRVDHLGAQVPTPHLIGHLHLTGPEAVALSGSIATRLPTAHATITACQAAGVPVLVGGAAFGPDGRYARLFGADMWAPDARAAADRLDAGLPPRPSLPHQAVDDLPHLADQEYTLVIRSGGGLVRETLTDLEERFPPMREYSRTQRRRTAEDIAHIVDFLATALYTDDDDLFTGFILWTADVLTTRGVPAHSLLPVVDLLTHRLRDLPRAVRLLHRGHRALLDHPAVSVPDPETAA